jgi:hypothetical protein
VTSIDWETYHTLPLGIQLPAIDIVFIDRPSEPATGAGETAITLVAAALSNAWAPSRTPLHPRSRKNRSPPMKPPLEM